MYPMSTEQEIHQVEITLAEAKHTVELGEAINRLKNNKDFQFVIHEGYFRDEASRLVFLTADATISPEMKESVWGSIRGIGEFRAFMVGKLQLATQARKEIEDNQETLDSLRSEGDDE